MKILFLFLPIVIGYKNYYVINSSDLLVCGYKSINANNFIWFVSDIGVFKNISKFANEICVLCLAVYFCEYDVIITKSLLST